MKRITRFKKRTWVLLGVVAVIAAMASVGAYAFWTTGGSGAGSATAGTTVNVTVKQTSVTASNLYPGGPAEALFGNFDNPNLSPVNYSSVTAVVTPFTTSFANGKPECTQADFAIGGAGTGPGTIPGGPALGVGNWSGLNISLLENGFNQDNCKSVVAGITYTVNP